MKRTTDQRCTLSKMARSHLLLAIVFVIGNNNKVQAEFTNASQGLETAIKFWFPEDAEFNESCVSEGCPALNNFTLCVKQINISVLHDVFKTAVGCMRQPICGKHIHRRPSPQVFMTTEEWLSTTDIYGTAITEPDTGYLTNVSNIQLELRLDHNQTHQLPLQLALLLSDLRMIGTFQLDLSLRTMVPSILGQALSVTIPQAKYDVELEFFSTMSINNSVTGSIKNVDIKLLNPILKAHPIFCGLDMPEDFPSILTIFTSMTQIIIDKSSWAVRKSAFLEKYFQSAFRIVSNKLC